MSRVGFGWHAIVGASAFLLACVAGYPAIAQPSVEYLKIRYVQTCELARAADAIRIQRQEALIAARSRLSSEFEAAGSYALASIDEYDLAQFEYRGSLLAWQMARSSCLEHKHAYLQALAEQIMLAALTEPPPETAGVTPPPSVQETARPPGKPPRPPRRTTRRPPSSYQTDSTAAAAAIMNIIGGAIATSRPPRGPGRPATGHRHRKYY
jgi:hypothetical protein